MELACARAAETRRQKRALEQEEQARQRRLLAEVADEFQAQLAGGQP